MKTAAFVPIRLNSQRVSGKNLRPLSGSPLMCHILRTLTEVEGIDEVYVYCSDERIREFLPEGVRFLRRSEELDRDTTLGREIYDSFTAEVEADLYVLAHATSPFIRAETVADALRNLVIDLPAAPGQSPVQKIGRTHPVDIVITHNADADPLPDLFQDQSSRLVHIFHLVGIVKLVQSSV